MAAPARLSLLISASRLAEIKTEMLELLGEARELVRKTSEEEVVNAKLARMRALLGDLQHSIDAMRREARARGEGGGP
jgi:hypothetical protein